MITLTTLKDEKFALNYKLIETIREAPDTTIKLSNDRTYIVKEPLDEILDLIYRYEKSIRRV